MVDFSVNATNYYNANISISQDRINDLKTKMEWNGNNGNKEEIYNEITGSYSRDNSAVQSNSNVITKRIIREKIFQEKLFQLILNIVTKNKSDFSKYVLGDMLINHITNTSPTITSGKILDLIPSVLLITKIQNLEENFKKVFNEFYQLIIQEGQKIKSAQQSPTNAFQKLSLHFFRVISDANYTLFNSNKISIDIEELFSDQNISIEDVTGVKYENIFDFFFKKLKQKAIQDLSSTNFSAINKTSNHLKGKMALKLENEFNFSSWNSSITEYNDFLSNLTVSDEETKLIIQEVYENMYNSNSLIYFPIEKYKRNLELAITDIIDHTENYVPKVLSEPYLKGSKLLEQVYLGLFNAFSKQQNQNMASSLHGGLLDLSEAKSILLKNYPIDSDQELTSLLVDLKLMPKQYTGEDFESLFDWLKEGISVQGSSIELTNSEIELPFIMNTSNSNFYSQASSPSIFSIKKKVDISAIEKAELYLDKVIQSPTIITIKDIEIFKLLSAQQINTQEELITALSNPSSLTISNDFLFQILNKEYPFIYSEYDAILKDLALEHKISFSDISKKELKIQIKDSNSTIKVPKITFKFEDSLNKILRNTINLSTAFKKTQFFDQNFWVSTKTQIVYEDWVTKRLGIEDKINQEIASFNLSNKAPNFLSSSNLTYNLTSPITGDIRNISQNKTRLEASDTKILKINVLAEKQPTDLSFNGEILITIVGSLDPQFHEAKRQLKEFIENNSGPLSKYDPSANSYIQDDLDFEQWVLTWNSLPSTPLRLKQLIEMDLGIEYANYTTFIDNQIKKTLGFTNSDFTVLKPQITKSTDPQTKNDFLLRQVVFEYSNKKIKTPVDKPAPSTSAKDFVQIIVTLFDGDSWKQKAIENLEKNQQNTINAIQSSDKITDEWKKRLQRQIDNESFDLKDQIMYNPNINKASGLALVAASLLNWNTIFNQVENNNFIHDPSFDALTSLYNSGIPPQVLKLLSDNPDFLDRLLSVQASKKMIQEIANNKKLLNSMENLDISSLESFITTTINIYKNKKYVYLGIGAGSGLLAVSSGFIAATSILSNKKINKINNSLKMSKKTRKLIPIIASLISISLIAVSTSFTLFFFINQGGF